MTPSPKQKMRKVKAYGVTSSGELMTKFDSSHNVFAPRVYINKEGAWKVARSIKSGGEIAVVEVTLSYLQWQNKNN